MVREEGGKPINIVENGKSHKISKDRAIIKQLHNQAIKGERHAQKILTELKTSKELNPKVDLPIRFTLDLGGPKLNKSLIAKKEDI